ncbi:MAG: hypothetical protein IKU65_06035 [Oscillospiraceae bacterium]|nr:hypothetical protein [Oscillospiraceae bacterium]
MTKISEAELLKKRPIPFYYITTHDPEELTYEKFYADLSDMKEKGYGGVVPFNRPPYGFSQEMYFTEAWFTMIENCLRACRDLGLRVWLNDDYECPPGDIGGRLQKIAPHLKPLRLRLDGDEVKVEEVSWGFPAYEHPESPLFFQKYVYEEYKRRFGEYFGSTIIGFFSDCDSRRVNSNVYNTDSPMKDYFPWTETFAQTFKEAYGYDITPYLASIIRREPSPQSRDYWEHNNVLYMNWMGSNYEWCRKNGLEYTFHTSDSAPYPVSTTYFNSAFAEGKAIDAGQFCDWPGTDHETLGLNGAPWIRRDLYVRHHIVSYGDGTEYRRANFYDTYGDLRAKQAQSSAFLYDKRGVMCEMYASASWRASYKDLRNLAAWQFMQGVNFVVLQAYHYKLWGETKHFAPLTFGPYSHANFTMREFNDWLAETSYICSQGKPKFDVALLDSTDHIWAGTGDSSKQLELAKKFNHLPCGYILSDLKGIRRKAKNLRAVVNPGLPLTESEREEIRALGLKLYEYEDADKVAKELPCGISWNGSGELMFLRRDLGDGNELLVVGNIETDDTISGVLTFAGKDYEIELVSGEMAFFGGGYDSWRAPVRDEAKVELPETADVSFDKPNILPLVRFENEEGRGVTLKNPEYTVDWTIQAGWLPKDCDALAEKPTFNPVFKFTTDTALYGLELMIPEDALAYITSVSLDGKELTAKPDKIFDDSYKNYTFDVGAGAHTIALKLSDFVKSNSLIYLRGNFDAKVDISGEYIYGGSGFITEYATVALSERSSTLKTGLSWTEQGQPTYSGTTDYSFTVEIPENIENATLVIPDMHDPVKVYVDGKHVTNIAFAPYRTKLNVGAGEHKVVLSVCNTLGNMLEAYKIPSGLTTKPYITCEKE